MARAEAAILQLTRADRIIDELLKMVGPLRARIRGGGMTRQDWRDAFIGLDVRVYGVAGDCWLDLGVREKCKTTTKNTFELLPPIGTVRIA
jgi:hypothetical protein